MLSANTGRFTKAVLGPINFRLSPFATCTIGGGAITVTATPSTGIPTCGTESSGGRKFAVAFRATWIKAARSCGARILRSGSISGNCLAFKLITNNTNINDGFFNLLAFSIQNIHPLSGFSHFLYIINYNAARWLLAIEFGQRGLGI